MSKKKTFKTLERATAYLFFSEEIELNIITKFPDIDDLTDEKQIDDDDLGATFVSDIADTLEKL